MATITKAGAVPSSPTTLKEELLAVATALAPGLTVDLPASLVEDLSSTGTGALVVQDQAYVDLVNSISPYTANPYILNQLGNVYGVQQGVGSNGSVYVTFTGTVGFVVNVGFLVSDGTYQYSVQDATIIPSGGTTAPVYCLATVAGTWAIPSGTVNFLTTSAPAGVSLTCTNPLAGTPGADQQSIASFQYQVIQAGRAVATGLPTLVKTALKNVPNVSANQISIQSVSGGWEILVGGGDPYTVANAIYQNMFNIQDLQGSQGYTGTGTITGTSLVLTASTTLLLTGTVIYGAGITLGTNVISGSGDTYVIAPSQTAGPTTITTGGLTEVITIDDFPDSYPITFVVPFAQSVGVSVNWETVAGTNFVSNTIVAPLVQTAIAAYINTIFVGQSISVLELQAAFLLATAGVLVPTNISQLTFIVIIDNNEIAPPPGGVLIPANPEGFYTCLLADVVVTNV